MYIYTYIYIYLSIYIYIVDTYIYLSIYIHIAHTLSLEPTPLTVMMVGWNVAPSLSASSVSLRLASRTASRRAASPRDISWETEEGGGDLYKIFVG